MTNDILKELDILELRAQTKLEEFSNSIHLLIETYEVAIQVFGDIFNKKGDK